MTMTLALLTEEQLDRLLERAAERGAQKALEQTRALELTTAQAAEILKVAPKTVRKMVKDGRLVSSRRVGKDYRFRTSDIEAAQKGGPANVEARRILATLGIR